LSCLPKFLLNVVQHHIIVFQHLVRSEITVPLFLTKIPTNLVSAFPQEPVHPPSPMYNTITKEQRTSYHQYDVRSTVPPPPERLLNNTITAPRIRHDRIELVAGPTFGALYFFVGSMFEARGSRVWARHTRVERGK